MSSPFADALAAAGGRLFRGEAADLAFSPEAWRDKRWFFVPYDQLHLDLHGGSELPADEVGLIFVESLAKGRRRPYHKQKLALVLANQRHFALEAAAQGIAVHYLWTELDYADSLRAVMAGHSDARVHVAEPAERELRLELAPLVEEGRVEVLPHRGWLTTPEQFTESCAKQPYRMDSFYRRVRKDSGWLMEQGKPVGGKWSFDAENRQPWKGEPAAPERPSFPGDPIKEEVVAWVERTFADHPGELELAYLPATFEDAEQAWAWAQEQCLKHFGPYEDAMSEASTGLFHTRIAPLLNLHRLLPRRVVEDALASAAPLASREGFLRQIAGWREFVRHVHRETDGFDGLVQSSGVPLPPVFWGQAESGLRCLDHTVETVWQEGYSHHITRLMVLGNLATLLDLDARELSDWFWVAYTDAYDWVVEPNVLGMATWATGGVMTTKPYISGAAYIDRMGDHCGPCAFHPKKTCPITRLYWAWLGRHADELEGNVRMAMPLRSLAKRDPEKRAEDQEIFQRTRSHLAQGLEV